MKLSKKTILWIVGIGTPSLAFTIGVSVAISLKREEDFQKDFVVSLASDSSERYFITKMDPQQNKPVLADESVWDINTNMIKSNDLYLSIKETIGLSQDSPNTYVIGTIPEDKEYSNGLEKFLFDLIQMTNNADDVTLVFPTGETTLKGFSALTNQQRYELLIKAVNTYDPSFTNLDDEMSDALNQMLIYMLEVQLVDFENNEVRDTQIEDIKKALDEMGKTVENVKT